MEGMVGDSLRLPPTAPWTAPPTLRRGLWGEPALQQLPLKLPLHRGRDETLPMYGGSRNLPLYSNHVICL